jgi:hypothetical protein
MGEVLLAIPRVDLPANYEHHSKDNVPGCPEHVPRVFD